MPIDLHNSVVENLNSSELKARGIQLMIKRDDLIHTEVSGNKWRKLKYNVERCKQDLNEGILTFGGAYSNHLLATASACNQLGIASVGIVRGDELSEASNETLQNSHRLGMQLVFVPRDEYSDRNEKSYLDALAYRFPNYLIIPEGGANYYGMIGCQEMIKEIDQPFDAVFVAQGTTTTSCGILMGLRQDQSMHVVPVLKGFDSEGEMRQMFRKARMEDSWIDFKMDQVTIHADGHFGGYGKYTQELLQFIRQFYQEHRIQLDPIYTGKAMYALMQQVSEGTLDNQRVLFVHTGGIQGATAIEQKAGFRLFD